MSFCIYELYFKVHFQPTTHTINVLKAKTLRILLKTINKTLSQVWNICLLSLVIIFIFGVLGVELFGELECSPDYPCLGLHRNSNFHNVPMAMLTLYKVCTGDNWSGILKDTMRKCRPDDTKCQIFLFWVSPLYFSSFVIIAQCMLAYIVVASIMQALKDSEEEAETELRRQRIFSSAEGNAEISTLDQTDNGATSSDSISL